ncbi:MAG: hypothetical protein MK212_15200 [Saprospiraceae bacterium]|nr:hypothetical protein [Saprospiraceae bacterium]
MSAPEKTAYTLPILRNYSEEDNDYKDLVVNIPLGDNLGAFLATVSTEANGKTAISYTLKSHLKEPQIEEKKLFMEALSNLEHTRSLVNGLVDPDTGNHLISIESEIGLATSLLVDFPFLESMAKELQTEVLLIGIINSNMVGLTHPNSSFLKKLKELAVQTDYEDSIYIHPALYEWKIKTTKFNLLKKY